MKKIISYVAIAFLMLGSVSCKDYLETASNSNADNNFVFSTEESTFNALLGVYQEVRTGNFLTDRVTMNFNAVGSDFELRPDFGISGRGALQSIWPSGGTSFMDSEGGSQWNQGYKAISWANSVIVGIEEVNVGIDKATSPTGMTQMYAEAIILRAICYYELVRNFGDIPMLLKPAEAGMDIYIPATDRWLVLDQMISDLERVIPMMLWADQMTQNAERISKGFAYGLLGKLCLNRGGYSLLPDKNNPSDWGKTGRDEANWRKYYEKAETALLALVNSGKHSLITVDSRTPDGSYPENGIYGNPFQMVFQNQMDYIISKESLWEVAQRRTADGNWGYAWARVSPSTNVNVGNTSKSYGAVRFTPHYYYSFDPADMRRDVTCTVTATNGAGTEVIIDPAGVGDGGLNGICLNKWDRMRMKDYYDIGNRSGINFVYMRYSDALLLLAETELGLGKEGDAKTYLKMVRERAFAPANRAAKVEAYIAGLSGASLLEAIKMERAWELGGENQRKHDLIRWGDFSKAIANAIENNKLLQSQIAANGKYTFPNGETMSAYIYTKSFNAAALAASGVKVGTTYGTPAGKDGDAILAPGWRGVGNIEKFPAFPPTSLLAIKGLRTALTDAEVAALVADGYAKVTWGQGFADPNSGYVKNWWSGYSKAMYDAGKPARYFAPIPGTVVIAARGALKNYYGYANE